MQWRLIILMSIMLKTVRFSWSWKHPGRLPSVEDTLCCIGSHFDGTRPFFLVHLKKSAAMEWTQPFFPFFCVFFFGGGGREQLFFFFLKNSVYVCVWDCVCVCEGMHSFLHIFFTRFVRDLQMTHQFVHQQSQKQRRRKSHNTLQQRSGEMLRTGRWSASAIRRISVWICALLNPTRKCSPMEVSNRSLHTSFPCFPACRGVTFFTSVPWLIGSSGRHEGQFSRDPFPQI